MILYVAMVDDSFASGHTSLGEGISKLNACRNCNDEDRAGGDSVVRCGI
jgi:hypothetical protein